MQTATRRGFLGWLAKGLVVLHLAPVLHTEPVLEAVPHPDVRDYLHFNGTVDELRASRGLPPHPCAAQGRQKVGFKW